MATDKKLFPVILAGGSGTRFWPLSRKKKPKQLLPLATKKTLVADTFDRMALLAPPANMLVVCGKAHAQAIRRLVPKIPARGVVIEPAARNTAPAIGLAAIMVAARDPKGVLLVTPSDHGIRELGDYTESIRAAVSAAEKGALVAIGVKPTRPETGYGYVKAGEAHPRERRARKALAFVEKPDLEKAKSYLTAGDYLWNTGMFAFRADRILDELRQHLPACAAILDKLQPLVGTRGFGRALGKWFPECPSISIDYAVMEKAEDIAVVPATFPWSDLGSFAAIPEVREADAAGNVVGGDVIAVDSVRNVVVGHKGRIVTLVGVSDLIVVDAGDALLVCRKDRAQDVRKIVDELTKRGDDQLL